MLIPLICPIHFFSDSRHMPPFGNSLHCIRGIYGHFAGNGSFDGVKIRRVVEYQLQMRLQQLFIRYDINMLVHVTMYYSSIQNWNRTDVYSIPNATTPSRA